MSGFTLDRLDELRAALSSSFDLLVKAFAQKLDQGFFPLLNADEVRNLLRGFPLLADVPANMMKILWAPWCKEMAELRAVKIIMDTHGPSDAKTWFLRAISTRPEAKAPARGDLDAILTPEADISDKVAAADAVWTETYPLHENPWVSITGALMLRDALPDLVAALEALIAADIDQGRRPLMTLADLSADLDVDMLVSLMGSSSVAEQSQDFILLLSRCLMEEIGISLQMSTRPDAPEGSFTAFVQPVLANNLDFHPDIPKLTIALSRIISAQNADARKRREAMTAEDILEKIPDVARPALMDLEEKLLDLLSQGAMPYLVTGPFDGVTLFGQTDPRSVDILGLFRSYMRKAHGLVLQGQPLDSDRMAFWLDPT